MIKTLAKFTVIFLLTITAWVGFQNHQVQDVQAVEIQPGSPSALKETPPDQVYQPDPINQPGTAVAEQINAQPDLAGRFGLQTQINQINLPSLNEFIASVSDGQAGIVRGLYIPGLIALKIVQQPEGQIDFISYEEDSATQFQSPSHFGVIGLLAHNFLSGRFFFQIEPGQVLTIVYGDGRIEEFKVDDIHDYQRLTELDLHSDFQDLNTQKTVTADQVFQQYYQGQRHLTLQTCLESEGNWNWGIRMITAYPKTNAP